MAEVPKLPQDQPVYIEALAAEAVVVALVLGQRSQENQAVAVLKAESLWSGE